MSTTIDERVVEMRFDNSHFEKNIRETMSTLEKLKQKLNLTGASKGLESINTSANKVNMSGMANAIDTVHSKFSALEIMGVTALANITNSAINAGKRFVSALTVAPVKDGWQEYEMTLNAVQTTMAGTGKTAEEVEKELKKLDEYADKTVYSTADMLNNLPKFTNAGVELEKATKAMIGIANATALAGGDAGKASIAFYNLGQAIGTGYLTRMDYNSINNAGIATMEWKEQMVEAAIAAGTLTKVNDNLYKAGKKELTIQQLFIDGLQEQWATTEVMMKVFGDYGDETTEIGKKSYSAAQDIKTFSMMMDSLKATAGTGWKDTWQIVFGGLDEAKEFWTGLTNFISNIIEKMADFRNNLLEGALTFNPFSNLLKKLNDSGVGKAVEKIDGITKSLEYYQDMVTKVWKGNYKNQPVRSGLLEGEGHNYKVIQSLVNKGYQYKLTVEDVAEAEKKYGVSVKESTDALLELSDAKLKEIGLTDDEIKMYRELEKQSKETGKSIAEIVKTMEDRDGRTLLIESFANAGDGLVGVFKAMGEAWREIFPPMTSIQLYNIIDAINKFSEHLRLTEKDTGKLNENGEKLRRTFKGLAAILDIAFTLIGGPISIALKLAKQLFEALGFNILDVTAFLGDGAVMLRDMIDELLDFSVVFEVLAPRIKAGAEVIKEWFSGLKDITRSDVIDFFKSLGESIKDLCKKINDHFDGVPGDIIAGLANGLKDGAKKAIDAIVQLAKDLIVKFNKVMKIESPSKVFFAIGGFIISGLIGGLLASGTELGDTISNIASNIGNFFKNIDWGKIFAGGMSAGLLYMSYRVTNIMESFTAPMDAIAEVLETSAWQIRNVVKQTAKVLKGFARTLNGIAFERGTAGIKNLAVSLLLLVGAIVVLTFLDVGKMYAAVGVIALLAAILATLTWAISKISEESFALNKEGIKITGVKTALLTIALAILTMGIAMKMIGSMDPKELMQGFLGLLGAVGILILLMGSLRLVAKNRDLKDIRSLSSTLKGLGVALLLMVLVMKLVSLLDPGELAIGAAFMVGFLVFIKYLVKFTKVGGNQQMVKLGGTLIGMSVAMLLMVAVMKLVSRLEIGELLKGAAFMAGFILFVKYLVQVTKIGGKQQIAKLGGMLLGMSAAMILLVGVMKLINLLDLKELAVGAAFMAGFIVFTKYLVKATTIGGKQQSAKIAGTLLAMSVSIAILAGVCVLLSTIDLLSLVKGIAAVGLLAYMMTVLLKSTKDAKNIKDNLIPMAVAIGIMAASVAILSFIDWKDLAPAALAMSALMGMFALMESQAKNVKGSMGCLIVMTVAIGMMAAAIILISKLAPENALSSALALSTLLLAMVGALKILSTVKKMAKDKLITAGISLLALCGVLAAIALVLSKMDGISNALSSATALSLMLGAMTIVIAVINTICGKHSIDNLLIGCLSLLALCGVISLIASTLVKLNGINDALQNAAAISILLATMTGVITVLSLLGPLAWSGIGAIVALTAVVAGIGALIVGLGYLVENNSNLETFLNKGLDMLIKLGEGLGRAIGAFVGGIAAQISAALPGIGEDLSEFMKNSETFISGAKDLGKDDSLYNGVKNLSAAIVLLSGASFIHGITTLFSFGLGSFALLGLELSAFMKNAEYFFSKSESINPEMMTGIKTLAEAISILVSANFLECLNIFSGSSLEKFGSDLTHLGEGIKDFINSVGVIDATQVDTAKNAAEIIKTLASAANEIPNTGGLLADLVGDNDMATWADQLSKVGQGITGFIKVLADNGVDSNAVSTADTAANVIKALASAASEIPNTGGLLKDLIGDNNLSTFATELPKVGEGIVGFVDVITKGGITSDAANTANTAAGVIKTLAEAASEIPNAGGWLANLIGDNDLSTFATELPNVGAGIAGFASELGVFDKSSLDSINAACNSLQTITNLANADIKDTGSKLKSFGEQMKKFGEKIKEFVGSIIETGGDNISLAVAKVKEIVNLASSSANVNIDSLKTFGESLKKFAKDGVKGFIEEFSGSNPKAEAKKAVKELLQEVIDGAEDKEDDIEDAFEDIAESAVDSMKKYSIYKDAKEAGKYVVEGFAAGISANTFMAEAKAKAMAEAALAAARKALKEKSPSRAFYEVGDYAGQGFVNALHDSGLAAYSSGYEMAESARKGLSKAITRVSDIINSDIDSQPTIRPVLDLSDVESGAGYLNSMFNNGPSIGVMSNLKAISSGMNDKIQNGVNGDVVSAIDKLRKDLGNVGRDTYNINGITYDDGSNITDAVKTLIRAAKVERRV